jgi:hypothetical protein
MTMRTVNWKHRSSRDGDYAEHHHDGYVVTVQDMDGDGTEWKIWLRDELESAKAPDAYASPIASGYVCVRAIEDFRAGQEIAIDALDAVLRARATST